MGGVPSFYLTNEGLFYRSINCNTETNRSDLFAPQLAHDLDEMVVCTVLWGPKSGDMDGVAVGGGVFILVRLVCSVTCRC